MRYFLVIAVIGLSGNVELSVIMGHTVSDSFWWM